MFLVLCQNGLEVLVVTLGPRSVTVFRKRIISNGMMRDFTDSEDCNAEVSGRESCTSETPPRTMASTTVRYMQA